jgi:hypothetical protein
MTQLIMGHGVSRCFGTNLAPMRRCENVRQCFRVDLTEEIAC